MPPKKLALLLPLLLLLSGCTLGQSASYPTPLPTEWLDTVIALTVAAGQPAQTPTPPLRQTQVEPPPSGTPPFSRPPIPRGTAPPTITPIPTATRTPTITPVPSETAIPPPTSPPLIPLAEIDITSPGPLSKVVSPFALRALLVPGAGGKVTIELLGEDGRLLVRQLIYLNENLGRKAGLVAEIHFEIPGVAELARLQISIEDAFGRPKALTSVDLLLLSAGAPDPNPPGDHLEAVVIKDPLPGALVQGGRLILSGLARPTNDPVLIVELITEKGKVVGTRLVEVPAGPANVHRPFIVEVPYTVSEPTWARLSIRARGSRIPGNAYLTSLEVYLSP